MLKLYKRSPSGRITHYHEAWVEGSYIIEHWGPLGEKGDTRQHIRDTTASDEDNIEKALAGPLANGYEPIDESDHAMLIIEYPIKGMGTPADLEKRAAVEDLMNQTLGWTGLGMCDGGSIGSGTMEVACPVVDFDLAKAMIERTLKGTPFGDFGRVYNEAE